MNIGTITKPNAKGQVVIPKRFREELGINKDVLLNISLKGNGVYITPIKSVIPDVYTDSGSYLKLLEKTQGAWVSEDWNKYDRLEKKRRKIELKASELRKKAW